jgi:homoserine O-acetyltransferase
MRLSAQALAFDIVGRNAIKTDPNWHNGDFYEHGTIPEPGLAQARMIGHITYLSAEMMSKKFGREKRDDKRFQVESYLEYQGQKFVNRFDANSYIHITRAMDVFDVEESYGSIEAAMARVKSRFLVVALSSDWLFPPEQSLELSTALVHATKSVSYCLLHAPHGHDAFLVDIEHLADVVGRYLANFAPNKGATEVVATTPAAPETQRDYDMIEQFVRPGSRVIDIGCGDGALLARLAVRRQAQTLGLDIDLRNLIQALSRGQDVIQCDVDEGLAMVPDHAFDYAILSQTLQVVRKPRHVLHEMLRVAREGIVSFPNFGQWSSRLHVGVMGRMPKSKTLPYEWYDTPNIHLSTLQDFRNLCREDNIKILDVICTPSGLLGRLFLALGLKNLGADRVLVRITKG